MKPFDRLLCLIGWHVYDAGELRARKLRAACMGVNISSGLPCGCSRCGARFWR